MRSPLLPVLLLVSAVSANAQGVREHTRLTGNRPTRVTEAQASELTLTLTEASVRPIQIWVRTAGTIDAAGRSISAELPASQEKLVRAGQRARAFSPDTRSRMYQAEVTQVTRRADRVGVTLAVRGQALDQSRHFIVEIVTEDREVLSVPNEAIISTEGTSVVYVQGADGGYERREVHYGIQGELFTEVLDGLKNGEHVVTIGSFFIDAEHKLKGS